MLSRVAVTNARGKALRIVRIVRVRKVKKTGIN